MNEEAKYNLVVGLGNPGTEYAGTRHNAGFEVIDLLLKKFSGRMEEVHGCSSHYWKGNYAGSLLLLQKPETFMNLSGNAVAPLLAKHGLGAENLLVISDDVSLPLGKLRVRTKGSAGGHNGLSDIEAALGTQAYCRLRVGVGSNFSRGHQIDYVLGKFDGDDAARMDEAVKQAAELVRCFATQGPDRAMNMFNKKGNAHESGN